MTSTSCCLLIFIPLQLMNPGSTQCSLDSIVDIKSSIFLSQQRSHIPVSAAHASCPPALQVSNSMRWDGRRHGPCACGGTCGSWHTLETTCHCQCGLVGWTTARCCRLT
ncbi:LOW QUALITY PROTEIN: resistin-like beta [Hipposideros larvatus]